MHYRAEIDGLRAIAVLPIILFHAGLEMFSGGFVGVDIFFVISGYLITTIILSDLDCGRFSIISFYERRSRRILPTLFLVIFSSLVIAWFLLLPKDMKSFSQSLIAVPIFASNIFFWRTIGYFDPSTELKPLIHTWSLAVEEQYYMLFPLLLVFAWRFEKRWIFTLLAIVTLISLATAEYCATRYPVINFYLLPMRAWELLIGAMVAFYYTEHNIKKHNYWVSESGSLLGFALISYSVFSYNEQTPFPSFYALAPTIGAALIIIFATHKTLVGMLLGCKLFVALGLISYSAYLWHQPLFAFARQRSLTEPNLLLMLLLSVAVIPLAFLTWRLVERPFRNKYRYTRKQIFALGLAFSLMSGSIGLIGHFSDGNFYRNTLKARFDPLYLRLSPNYGLSTECENHFTESNNCKTHESPEILLWGDSFAMHLMDGLLSSNAKVKAMQSTVSFCGPFFDIAPIRLPGYGRDWALHCLDSNDKVLDFLKKNKSIKYVVLGSLFTQFVDDKSHIMKRDGEIISGKEEAYLYFEKTLKIISDLGMIPVVFSPTPQSGSNIGSCLLKAIYFNESKTFCNFDLSSTKGNTKEVYDFLNRINKNFKVVWLPDAICSSGRCNASDGDIFIYRDDRHLSHEGSAFIGKKMNFYNLITGKI